MLTRLDDEPEANEKFPNAGSESDLAARNLIRRPPFREPTSAVVPLHLPTLQGLGMRLGCRW